MRFGRSFVSFARLSLAVLRLYLRDPLTVALSLALVVFMMVLFGLVMGEDQFDVALPVAVDDRADNPASRALIERLNDDELLVARAAAGSDGIAEMLRRAQAIAGLEIAPGFDGRFDSDGRIVGLTVITAEDDSRWVRIGLERLEPLVAESGAAPADGAPWRLVSKPIAVVKNRYIDFIFPGVLAMAIMQTCLMSGVVLLQAKEIGVIRRLQVTPMQPVLLFGAFVTGRLGVVVLQLVVLVLVAVLGFGAEILASWWELALAGVIGVGAFMSLGVLTALLAPSLESGNLIAQTLSLPMAFLCGVFFKVGSLPAALEWLPRALPLTYLVDTLRGLINLGLPLETFAADLAILAGWLVASLVGCAVAFRHWQSEVS